MIDEEHTPEQKMAEEYADRSLRTLQEYLPDGEMIDIVRTVMILSFLNGYRSRIQEVTWQDLIRRQAERHSGDEGSSH